MLIWHPRQMNLPYLQCILLLKQSSNNVLQHMLVSLQPHRLVGSACWQATQWNNSAHCMTVRQLRRSSFRRRHHISLSGTPIVQLSGYSVRASYGQRMGKCRPSRQPRTMQGPRTYSDYHTSTFSCNLRSFPTRAYSLPPSLHSICTGRRRAAHRETPAPHAPHKQGRLMQPTTLRGEDARV